MLTIRTGTGPYSQLLYFKIEMIELVFGVKSNDQALVVKELGPTLSLNFQEHDSAYKGCYYRATSGEIP